MVKLSIGKVLTSFQITIPSSNLPRCDGQMMAAMRKLRIEPTISLKGKGIFEGSHDVCSKTGVLQGRGHDVVEKKSLLLGECLPREAPELIFQHRKMNMKATMLFKTRPRGGDGCSPKRFSHRQGGNNGW